MILVVLLFKNWEINGLMLNAFGEMRPHISWEQGLSAVLRSRGHFAFFP